jgi:chemotaxis signal transduction protein
MIAGRDLAGHVSALREAFDRAFAEPPPQREEAPQKFLAVRAGGAPFAFRLAEIAGVAVDRKLTSLPSPVPELLGLAGLRGRLVPVYSLTALLGGIPESTAGRWLVLIAEGHVALATESVAGYRFGQKGDVLPLVSGAPHSTETLRVADGAYGIVSVPALVKQISSRVASVRPRQEHDT